MLPRKQEMTDLQLPGVGSDGEHRGGVSSPRGWEKGIPEGLHQPGCFCRL